LLFTNIIANSPVGINVNAMKKKSPSAILRGLLSERFFSVEQVMRRPLVATAVAIMAVMLTSAVDESSQIQVDEQEGALDRMSPEKKVDVLIAGLADHSFDVRQEASNELWRMGAKALPALRKATQDEDPEVVDRASELVLYISAGVLFDSSDKVKSLVLGYFRGGITVKFENLKKLQEMGQWRQVLHLSQLEKDPKVRKKLSEIVHATASHAAQNAMVDGDLDLVEKILNLSGDSDQAMVVRAWFYFRQGQLDRELSKADTMPGEAGTLWRLALYRASGNVAAAIREAKKADRPELAAAMQVLAGDPRPWLSLSMRRTPQDDILSRSCQIQMARLKGEHQQASRLAQELESLAVNEDSSSRVIACLAANGFRKKAVSLLDRFDPESAFDYHDSTESPLQALEILGIPKDSKPPYTEWVQSFTDRVVAEEDEDLYDRLLLLAGFLVRHGEGEHAEAVLKPLMTALEKDGSDVWFQMISKMPLYELAPQAISFLEQRGNEDGEIDLGVKNLLDSGKSVDDIWAAVKKRHPKDINKALHEIALLSGLIADPDHETDAINDALLDAVKGKFAAAQSLRRESLFGFAVKRHEIGVASKMVDGFGVGDGEAAQAMRERWLRTKLFLDAALLRWEKVEPVCAAMEKKTPGDYYNLVKWAISLRKLGRDDSARKVLDRALLLTMGDVPSIGAIALQLSSAGYPQDAFLLLKQALMMAEPGGDEFDRTVIYLANYVKPSEGGQTWKNAAALSEVYSRFTMLGRSNAAVLAVLNARFQADFFRGMDWLEHGKKEEAMRLFNTCRQLNPGSGALADDFFPALRKAGLASGKQYDEWFEQSYAYVVKACEDFPKAHNTHNTAAWLAARALRRLDEALEHAQKAVALRPYQGAYLDTMAEVWFAKGNRKKAVEWSKKAMKASISHAQGVPRSESQVLSNYHELYKQLQRFQHDPLPGRK
jgi:tetratricopeptide (TPR) repeat protein